MPNRDDVDPERPDRFTARCQRREAGERSADLAHLLLELPDAAVQRLQLDDELREAVERARSTRPRVARRREERRLAGVLRGVDLDALQALLDRRQVDDGVGARLFQLAERWRARLIDEGPAAFCEQFPSADAARMAQGVADARREQTSGRPRGAQRALFREVMAVLQAAEPAAP